MRIDTSSVNLSQNIAQTPDATQAGAKTHHGHHHGGDQVQISKLASQLAADPSKLAALQAAVSSGTYKVSPNQVANSIINDALQSY